MIFEVCCGSLEDCIVAYQNGADRIELNNALFLGGLTPSLGTFLKAKEIVDIPIVCMVRSRADGFCYNEQEFDTMLADAKIFLENGADGIVFGFLTEEFKINSEYVKKMVNLIHNYDKEAIFHMAIDCVNDTDEAINVLIEAKVDRILSKGKNITALEGKEMLKYMQENYGDKIEIIGGCGINSNNVKELLDFTGLKQVHGSCKSYKKDVTGKNGKVDYTYSDKGYEVVNGDNVCKMRRELDLNV